MSGASPAPKCAHRGADRWDNIRGRIAWLEVIAAGPPEWFAALQLREALCLVAPWRPARLEWWS